MARPQLLLRFSPLDGATGMRVAGEIDLVTRAAWADVLAYLADLGEDVDLDLTDVTFIDVGGATLLDRTGRRMEPRRLVVHGPPAGLRSLVELLWGPLSAIVIDDRAVTAPVLPV